MMKLTIDMNGMSQVIWVNPAHFVSVQETAQKGCLVNTTRGTYQVKQSVTQVIAEYNSYM